MKMKLALVALMLSTSPTSDAAFLDQVSVSAYYNNTDDKIEPLVFIKDSGTASPSENIILSYSLAYGSDHTHKPDLLLATAGFGYDDFLVFSAGRISIPATLATVQSASRVSEANYQDLESQTTKTLNSILYRNSVGATLTLKPSDDFFLYLNYYKPEKYRRTTITNDSVIPPSEPPPLITIILPPPNPRDSILFTSLESVFFPPKTTEETKIIPSMSVGIEYQSEKYVVTASKLLADFAGNPLDAISMSVLYDWNKILTTKTGYGRIKINKRPTQNFAQSVILDYDKFIPSYSFSYFGGASINSIEHNFAVFYKIDKRTGLRVFFNSMNININENGFSRKSNSFGSIITFHLI